MTQPSQQPTNSLLPGEMTRVMRAAGRSGPRVLRVGVVKQGHVVEERILKERSDVTIGSNEKNLFVIKANEIPSRFTLFQVIDGNYYLNFNTAMTGRVAQPGGTKELSELRAAAKKTSQGFRVALADDMRGKVTIGPTTFLFQFVAPPPRQPKPQLPRAVLRGASGIDWRTSIIAGVSFLAHFLAVGLLYSDWMDPVVDTGFDVKTIVEQVRNLPPPPPVEEKPLEEEESTKDKQEKQEEVAEQRPTPTKAKASNEKARLSSAEVATLSAELDSIDLDILATSNGMTATQDVLTLGESISLAAMDRAAESGGGVSSGGPGGLKLNAAGGAIAVGEAGKSLQDIGAKGTTVEQTSGQTAQVEGPKGKASQGGINVTGKVQNANSVVARMTAGVRACYQRGLAANPDIAGRVELRIQIGPGGEVMSVNATSSGNLPASVMDCVKTRAKSQRFQPPEGGQAVISTSFTFVKQ